MTPVGKDLSFVYLFGQFFRYDKGERSAEKDGCKFVVVFFCPMGYNSTVGQTGYVFCHADMRVLCDGAP